jgi:hypothetical protein
MIKILWIFVLAPLFLLCLPGASSNAEDPATLSAIQTAYTACVATLAAMPRYAPLAVHGFLAPPARYTHAELTDPSFATAVEARLVADFQQSEARCEVSYRLNLWNLDAALSDLASQGRQLTDVNQLLLIDRKQSWGEFSTYRAQIDANLRQASNAAITARTAGLDQISEGSVPQ